MKQGCRLIFLLAIVTASASCEKRPQADSGTDDAKLRPELAVARKNASPTPMPNEAKSSATPAP
jgi:hypothetical protein